MKMTNMFVDNINNATLSPEPTNGKRRSTLVYEIAGFVLLVVLLCVLGLIKRKCRGSSDDQISLYEISDETCNLVESGNMAMRQYQSSDAPYSDILQTTLNDDELFLFDSLIVDYDKLHIQRLIGVGRGLFMNCECP